MKKITLELTDEQFEALERMLLLHPYDLHEEAEFWAKEAHNAAKARNIQTVEFAEKMRREKLDTADRLDEIFEMVKGVLREEL